MSMTAEGNSGNNEELKSMHLLTTETQFDAKRIRRWMGHAYVVCSGCAQRYEITDLLNIDQNTTLRFRVTDESLTVVPTRAKVLAYALGLLTGGILFVFIVPFMVALFGKKASVWVASCQIRDCTDSILVAQYKTKLFRVNVIRAGMRDSLRTKSMLLECFRERRYDEAISELQKLTEELPPHPYLFYNIALCYEKMGSVQEAIKYYDDCRIRLEAQEAPNPEDLHDVQRKIDMLQGLRPSKE